MTSKETISTVEWQKAGVSSSYVVNLPGTDATVPLSFFAGKKNVYGQYAVVEQVSNGVYEAVRDPLGIGKLFYTQIDDGALLFSGEWRELLKHEKPIFALPRGGHVRLKTSGERELVATLSPDSEVAGDFTNDAVDSADAFHASAEGKAFKAALSARIDTAFQVIANLEAKGFRVFIALSGGLDSSIIAYAATRHLKHPLACTLDLGRSEDAEKSALITKEIGIEQVVFGTSEAEILDAVGDSPVMCQDYRDFNVHCTALNLLLAKNIRALADEQGVEKNKIIVLTGDTMNELTCDYAAEEVDGKIYYRLPRVGPKMLQQMLTGGLDTSDREILPFHRYGLACIQPYAVAYDLYLALPENVLKLENVKQVLNGHLVPESVMALLPKSKLRAQVGSKESMGVLGLCHYKGIDEKFFLGQLLGTENAEKKKVPITMGRYETETFE